MQRLLGELLNWLIEGADDLMVHVLHVFLLRIEPPQALPLDVVNSEKTIVRDIIR